MNFSLLFKKSESAREFIDKSRLEKILNIALIALFALSAVFMICPRLPMPHFISPFASFGISIFLSVLGIAAVIVRHLYKKSLDDEFTAFRAELEGDLYAEYAPFYRTRAKEYIDVNAHFGTDDSQTKIIVGYQRNTAFSVVVAVILSLATLGILGYALFGELALNNVFAPYISSIAIAALVGMLDALYIAYVARRFANFKRHYIGVTAQSLLDESYEEKLDQNYLYIMQNDEALQRRAESQFNKHGKGWFFGLFSTVEDTLLFGIVIAAGFIYLIVAWYLIKLIWHFIAEGLNLGGDSGSSSKSSSSSYSSASSSSSASYVTATASSAASEEKPKRLVLTGNGWNQYYEIDGKYITENGRLTDYELHGREIWYTGGSSVKTVGFIETSGYTGRVDYHSEWDGERIFDRYEYI